MERGEDLLGEAGAHLAGIAQPVAAPGADQQRAQVRPAAARRREAADHELLLGAHLDLAPGRRANAGLVARAWILADHALEPAPPRLGERLEAVVRHAPRELQARALAHLLLERGAPDGQRLAQEIAAARMQAVECDVDRRRAARPALLQ